MSKLSTCWCYRLHAEACSTNNSSFSVLTYFKSPTTMESDHAASPGPDGVILFFDVENPVPLATWFVSKAEGGGLSFVESSPKVDEDAAESKTTDVFAYIYGAHEYVLFDPYDEQSDKLSISGPRNFGNPEETASIYGELPAFSLTIDQTSLPSIPSEKTWKTIFSEPSHSLPPLPKLYSGFLESLLERRSIVVE